MPRIHHTENKVLINPDLHTIDPITLIKLEAIPYSKQKTLGDDHQILTCVIWILLSMADASLFISDRDAANLVGVPTKKFKKAKKALTDGNYIITATVTKDGKKASQYSFGSEISQNYFEKRLGTFSIEKTKLNDKKPPGKHKRSPQRRTLRRHLSKSKVTQHDFYYSYEAEMDVRFPSVEIVDTLLSTQCGSWLLSDPRSKDRLRACVSIIEMVRIEHYNKNNGKKQDEKKREQEAFDLFDDENPSAVITSTKPKHISQDAFRSFIGNNQGTKYNSNGTVEAKETLKSLGWLMCTKSGHRAPKKANKVCGERYWSNSRTEFNQAEYKSYWLSEDFYSNQVDTRRSSKSITISRAFRTEFRSLAMAELNPEVFEIFDKVSKKRDWDVATRSYQRAILEGFDYHRAYLDQKTYANIENSRVYTSIVSLPKKFRQYILIEGSETVEIDIKSAHAVIISTFIEDRIEALKWLELVGPDDPDKDIYYHLIDTLGVHDSAQILYPTRKKQRSQCKKVLNAYFNGATNQDKYDKKLRFKRPFKEYMKEEFPSLNQAISDLIKDFSTTAKRRNGAALKLQEIESDIMGTHFMCNSDFDCISIHDGLLVKKEEAPAIIQAVRERAMEVLGFEVQVDYK